MTPVSEPQNPPAEPESEVPISSSETFQIAETPTLGGVSQEPIADNQPPTEPPTEPIQTIDPAPLSEPEMGPVVTVWESTGLVSEPSVEVPVAAEPPPQDHQPAPVIAPVEVVLAPIQAPPEPDPVPVVVPPAPVMGEPPRSEAVT